MPSKDKNTQSNTKSTPNQPQQAQANRAINTNQGQNVGQTQKKSGK